MDGDDTTRDRDTPASGFPTDPTLQAPGYPTAPMFPPPPAVPQFPGPPGVPGPAGRPRRSRLAMVIVAIVVVVAVAVTGLVLSTSGGNSVEKTAAKKPAVPGLASFVADPVSPVEVDLTWTASGPTAYQYSITRNGDLLITLSGVTLDYRDESVSPKHHYVYSIAPVDKAGKSSTASTAEVDTPKPPPSSAARVQGRFDVHEVFVSENYTNFEDGDKLFEVWLFTPRCHSGPCNLKGKLFRKGQDPLVMKRSGRDYSGKTADNFGRCGSSVVRTTLTIDFHVTRAKYIDGEWRATKWAGTLDMYAPASLGCITSSSKLTLKGSLQS
jgi:hypothetical protein